MKIKLKEKSLEPKNPGNIEIIFQDDQLFIENIDAEISFAQEDIPLFLKMINEFQKKYEKAILLK